MTDVLASARTSVLTNSYLLYCILTFVDTPRHWGSRSKRHHPSHLAPCVTVCRDFYELAIRLLWRSLPNFFPLWHLLCPPNTERPPVTSSFSLQGNKWLDYLRKVVSARLYDDPLVWERFLCHTTHVRYIVHATYSMDYPEIIAHHLLLIQAVVSRNGGNPVLPLLHSILWAAKASTDSSFVTFFTSTLRSVTFSLESESGDEEARAVLFRRLHESSPHLETLEISSEQNGDEGLVVGPRLVQELLSFDRLRHLAVHCGLSGSATFLALISKPNLASLSVWNVSGPLGTPSPPTFVRDLVELSIMDTGPTLVGLFKLVRLETLKSATIRIQDSPDIQQETEEVLQAFYNALPTPGTLHSLTLRITGWGPTTEDPCLGLRDLVHPVLPLQDIRSFAFSGYALRPLIEVADIAALTDAWPKLERLVLDLLPPSARRRHVFSLDSLYYIHAYCPRIQELQTCSICLPVLGVHAIPAPLDRSGSPPHALRRLWARGVYAFMPEYSPRSITPEYAEALARYLLDLFPALDTEDFNPECPGPSIRRKSGWTVLARMYAIASRRERELQ